MNPRTPHSILLAAACLSSLAATSSRAQGANLITNPSFENGLTGWTAVASTATVVSYGAPGVPTVAAGTKIGGGTRLLLDVGGNAVIEQIVPIGAVQPGTNLRAGGYFGGGDTDDSRLVIRFLNASLVEIARQNLEYVTDNNRNFETVLMLREALLPIPAGTTSIAARIEMRYTCCGTAFGAADAIFAELTTASLTPPALPMNTELLNNPSFESGWAFGSPLSLNDLRGWEGIGNDPVVVKPYSDIDPNVPDTIVSCLIGGGLPSFSCIPGGAGNILSDLGGNGAVRQRLDVRGNAPQFSVPGAVALRISGFLGGVANEDDTARIDVRFLDANLNSIAPLPALGPVTQAHRNSETVLLKQQREFILPPQTQFIDIDVAFAYVCCGTAVGLADVISAMLVTPAPPSPIALNTNVASNGSFENGSLPESPLELPNPSGWLGTNAAEVEVIGYGSSSLVPSSAFAAASGLGGLVLSDEGGNAGLRRLFDVSADQALISSGRYFAYVEAWLGGVGTDPDRAEVRVRFLNAAGSQVGGASGLQILGPVTAADRLNQTTLLKRSVDVQIPVGTTSIEAEIRFTYQCCGNADGLADAVRVVVYDTLLGGPILLPGSGEDLRLFTGVNAAPTTGPGYDVKTATAFDVLNLRIESTNGTFNFAPMLLAANVYPTGSPKPVPPASLPSLVFDPFQMIVLANGYTCGGFGCFSVLPGGTQLGFAIPAGLSGQNIVMQALAIPIPGMGPAPINGFFAASEGHVIQVH